MFKSILLFICVSLALAQPLQPRAGGPIAKPLPDNCTVSDPLPTCHGGDGYKATSDFSSNLIYQAYYQSSLSADDTVKQCEEQCYGYGSPGTCKSFLLAYNVPTPEGWLGTDGGQLSPTACQFFNATASPDDFELAPDGQYVNETAGNIVC